MGGTAVYVTSSPDTGLLGPSRRTPSCTHRVGTIAVPDVAVSYLPRQIRVHTQETNVTCIRDGQNKVSMYFITHIFFSILNWL